MNFTTAADIAEWISTQSRPAPPKRTLLMTRTSNSDGMKEFTLQYNRLIKQNIDSRTAHGLRMAVLRAETAKDLCSRLSTAIRTASDIQDALSGLQLSMYAAANWVRRFADDRNGDDWLIIEEKKAGREIAAGIEQKVKSLFAKIQEKTSSKAILDAFQAFEIRWTQQEATDLKTLAVENKSKFHQLRKIWAKVEKLDVDAVPAGKLSLLAAFCSDLEDSRVELAKDDAALLEVIKAWLKSSDGDVPVWRNQGIKTLGPFGIAADINIEMNFEFPPESESSNVKLPGTYTVLGPKILIEPYEKGFNGKVVGTLSPVFPVTIKQSDPVAKLIRIPTAARAFAFAYPVISSHLEVTIPTKSTFDAFLLFGGFVYFDENMKRIQCNSLWVGNNMQLSAPRQLPASVSEALKEANRFRDITLPQLAAVKAKQFAWILPNEFHELQTPHGGWCYLYEDEAVNNYFAVASAESVMGLTKAFSIRDLKDD